MRFTGLMFLVATKICPLQLEGQTQQEFVTVQATDKFCCPSLIKKIFFGTNYRKEWGTFVTIPVFDIENTDFEIVEMGGGQQTTSLELRDAENKEWALRSVDKKYKPPNKFLNNIIMKTMIKEHISGSYPYAGLSVNDIATAAGVPTGKEYVYFVETDSAFGQYASVMANKIFLLVNRQPQKTKGIITTQLLERLNADKLTGVDSKEYLRARLVDWLIADWDRHDDQWRWIERKTDSGSVFSVVPRDRDQAFYRANSLLIKLAGLFATPYMDRFNKSGRGIKGLSKKAWELDKQFLSSLRKEEWETIIKTFQRNVSDEVIEAAIKKQPPEIFAIRGNALTEKLKSRRAGLLKYVMKYYEFLKRR